MVHTYSSHVYAECHFVRFVISDIPFQVSETDLKECLKSRLDVIADIVVEVDEPTWLQWQDRRAQRSPYQVQGNILYTR